MRNHRKVTVLTIPLFFVVVLLFGSNLVQAQTVTPSPSPSATPEITEDTEVLKIDTELVNLLFTAQDKDRRLLTSLKKEDIRVLEDGKPQEVFSFQRQVDLPLSLAILIDVSASQERTLPEEKQAAKSFVENVVRPDKDEVSIISFTGETTLEQGLTSNIARLSRAIDRVQFVPPSGYIGGGVVVAGTPPASGSNQTVAGSTAIWDAIWITAEEVLGDSPERTRRAIILLSDGKNTFGNKRLDDAVQAALKAGTVVYSIGVGDNYHSGIDENSLRRVSEQTGGRAFFPKDEVELRLAFDQIQIEMRSQYMIAYEPSNPQKDGTYRKVEVQLVNDDLAKQKIKVTHKQGYFAKSAPKQ